MNTDLNKIPGFPVQNDIKEEPKEEPTLKDLLARIEVLEDKLARMSQLTTMDRRAINAAKMLVPLGSYNLINDK